MIMVKDIPLTQSYLNLKITEEFKFDDFFG